MAGLVALSLALRTRLPAYRRWLNLRGKEIEVQAIGVFKPRRGRFTAARRELEARSLLRVTSYAGLFEGETVETVVTEMKAFAPVAMRWVLANRDRVLDHIPATR